MLSHFGLFFVSNMHRAGRAVVLLLQATMHLVSIHRSLHIILRQLDLGGYGSILVLSLIASLTGMIMVMQMGPSMETYGALSEIGGMLGLVFLNELGPIWAAIIVLARVGSAMAAEIGTMVVNEEIEALRVMGIDPVRFLVMPRIVAMVLAMPLLAALADAVGMAGGAFVANSKFGVTLDTFLNSAQHLLIVRDFFGGVLKAAIFGLIIAVIACDQGLATRGGAEGVGTSTTNTVRLAVIYVLIADLLANDALRLLWPSDRLI